MAFIYLQPPCKCCPELTMDYDFQNKKRKYNRDDDDREDRARTPDEPAEDPLKDAATLYVGNLCVGAIS